MQEEQASIQTNELNSYSVRLSDSLVEVQELCELLGYDDLRSVKSWCKKKKIPLLTIGKKTYTVKNFIDMQIENQLNEFVAANYNNADDIMRAVANDDELKPVLNKPAVKRKVIKPDKKKMSAASQRFLNDE